jgi:hypothetical protein
MCIRKYIVSDEKTVSHVGSGSELFEVFEQIVTDTMDNLPGILYT